MSANESEARNVLEPLRPPDSELAFRDDLTGLYNSRLLTDLLEERWDELAQLSGILSLVIIDLDLFKQVNDRYGHLSGDDVLRLTANLLRKHFRQGDLIFRYGGDEFVIFLPGVASSEAARLGERAREAMQAQEFFTAEERRRIDVPLSFSIGVASWPDEGVSGRTLLSRADSRLYTLKKAQAERLRRRRRIVWWLAATLGVMILTLGLLNLPEPGPDVIAVPLSRPASKVPDLNDAQLLLEIERLQARIESLTQERTQQNVADRKANAEEIRRLQGQIGDLNSRLKTPAPAAPVVDSEQASGEQPQSVMLADPQPPTVTAAEAQARPGETPLPLIQPKLLVPVTPGYPARARERRIEATIVLVVQIDEKGHVTSARTLGRPMGFGLDEAARTAALRSRWQPATRGGIPVAAETTLRVDFKMVK